MSDSNRNQHPSPDNSEPVLLMTAANDIEANSVTALLESSGIPSLSRSDGIGGILKVTMGSSSFGVDIYVNSEDLSAALEALEATGMLSQEELPPKETEGEEFIPPRHSIFDGSNRIRVIILVILTCMAAVTLLKMLPIG